MAFFKKVYSGLILGSVLGSCLVSQGTSAAGEVSESSSSTASGEVSGDAVPAAGEFRSELSAIVSTEKIENSEKQQSGQDVTVSSDGNVSMTNTENVESVENATDDVADARNVDATVNVEDTQNSRGVSDDVGIGLTASEDGADVTPSAVDSNDGSDGNAVPMVDRDDDDAAAPVAADVGDAGVGLSASGDGAGVTPSEVDSNDGSDGDATSAADGDDAAAPAADGTMGNYLAAGVLGAAAGNGMYILIDKLLGKK